MSSNQYRLYTQGSPPVAHMIHGKSSSSWITSFEVYFFHGKNWNKGKEGLIIML